MSFVYIYVLILILLFDAIRSGCHDDGHKGDVSGGGCSVLQHYRRQEGQSSWLECLMRQAISQNCRLRLHENASSADFDLHFFMQVS